MCRRKSLWPWLGKVFLDRISKIWPIKEKNYKLDIIKIKKFHTANYTVNRWGIQATDWKKIFANHIFDKGLVSRIYKEPSKLNNKKANTHWKNGQKIRTITSPEKI